MPRASTIGHDDFGRILAARARHALGEPEAMTAGGTPSGPYIGDVLSGIQERSDRPAEDPAPKLAGLYEMEDRQPEPTGQVMPPATLDAIADELRLTADLTPDALARLRRDFALANHPDRAEPAQRDLATRRMMAANVLIDQALKDKRNQPA